MTKIICYKSDGEHYCIHSVLTCGSRRECTSEIIELDDDGNCDEFNPTGNLLPIENSFKSRKEIEELFVLKVCDFCENKNQHNFSIVHMQHTEHNITNDDKKRSSIYCFKCNICGRTTEVVLYPMETR